MSAREAVLLDRFDPLLLLLRRGRRYPVHHVVALDDTTVRFRLAGLDHLTLVIGVVQLKAVLLVERRRGEGERGRRGEGEKEGEVMSEELKGEPFRLHLNVTYDVTMTSS